MERLQRKTNALPPIVQANLSISFEVPHAYGRRSPANEKLDAVTVAIYVALFVGCFLFVQFLPSVAFYLMDCAPMGNTYANITSGGFVAESGGWLYLVGVSDYQGGLYKVNPDSRERVLLTQDNARSLNVKGDWVYYISDAQGKSSLYKVPVNGGEPPQELMDTIEGLLTKFVGTASLQMPNFSSPSKLTPDELAWIAIAVGLEKGSYASTQISDPSDFSSRYQIPITLVEEGLAAVFGNAVDPVVLQSSSYYQDTGILPISIYDLTFSNPTLVYTCESAVKSGDDWTLKLTWYRDLSVDLSTQYISLCTTVYKLIPAEDGYRLGAAVEQVRYE